MQGSRKLWALAAALVIVAALAAGTSVAATRSGAGTTTATAAGCSLGNGIKHVVYVQFDNTHLFRDRAQFASDLEQMPHLLGFMRGNGTLLDNDHTILISHTAGGILSSLTGLYPDRNGVTVSNSYRYFKPDKTSASVSAFKYWTDVVDATLDPLPNMVNGDSGTAKTTPAPWVPYTRAGCDYGAVSTANVVLENTNTNASGDMTKVFGAGSPEWNEANANPTKAQADYVGIAIHCAVGGGRCAGDPNSRADLLPDEPGGYAAQALFGAKYVNPSITGGGTTVTDTTGAPIQDPSGNPGFPGFDGMPAKVSLGYVAKMQEAGVPVTFAYISDAHDSHPTGPAFGPGEAGYVQALQQYDQAFGTFFSRLAADGIDKSNTLFVFTVDENDHFAGGNSADGTWSHTTCNVTAGQTCPANQIGEVSLNINSTLPSNPSRPQFFVHSDSAPTYYVTGQPPRTNPHVRQLERDVAAAQAVDPYVSSSPSPVTLWMADPVEEQALHMVNADPNRTPTFTQFANPDYFISTFNTNCPDPAHSVADCVDYHFAWSHGDATDDIGRTWLGFVGPGVKSLGQTSSIWSDHTDVQPTMLSLLGLSNDYVPDGRVLVQALETKAVPQTLTAHRETLLRLADIYKQVNAPFGQFAKDTLVASTHAVASGSTADDSRYTTLSNRLISLTADRDALAAQMRSALNGAAFGGQALNEQQAKSLIARGRALLDAASALASS
ncbi:MAG: hypothetical protein QOE36_3140 [Gaiellaceae bacterium]|jgi:hypothetical protein|nr:hypothetical protein [Gaiellaceae bacterium]